MIGSVALWRVCLVVLNAAIAWTLSVALRHIVDTHTFEIEHLQAYYLLVTIAL